jgi:Ca2+/Na+ antiporter
MKILKRNYEHRNLLIFLIFSMVYLQAIYSLSQGQTLLTFSAINSFFYNHYLIFGLTLTTIFMILNVKKNSDKVLLFCLSMIAGKTFMLLAASFNKLILGLNFVYLVFAFYFWITWELEIEKASYNPLFSKDDLEKSTRFNLEGRVENVETGEGFEVLVTNIDENSCFALIVKVDAQVIISTLDPKGQYRLLAKYENVKFTHLAELSSTYDQGIGLNFIEELSPFSKLNWSDLYKVCLERGLFE